MTNILTAVTALEKRSQLSLLLRKSAAEKITLSPVSAGQQALWFLYQSAKESPAYNIGFCVRLKSQVDETALRRALQGLLDRHASLRAHFILHEGRLTQATAGYQAVTFQVHDAGNESEESLSRRVSEAYERPFDLEKGPVFRADLFRVDAVDSVFLITVNHIVYDGWSLWLNLEELGDLYHSEVTGLKSALPRIEATFQDFIKTQESLLSGPRGAELWNYWKTQLGGELPTLNLPTDYTRPPVQTFRGASHHYALPRELAERCRTLAKAEGVTLFTLLMAAFQVLLHRYSGQEDILVGTPTAGPRDARFANVVGYLVNPIVIRGDLSANPAFRTFLATIHQTLLGGVAHQDFPFPLLVERLRPKRDPSHSPIFQVSFVFQRSQRSGGLLDLTLPAEYGAPDVRWGGLDVEYYDLAQQEGQFDLELELINIDDAIFGSFKYNSDLFHPSSIARLADSFSALLGSIVQDCTQSVGQLSILSPDRREAILRSSGTVSGEEQSLQCLHTTFEARAAENPSAIALIDGGRQLSYQELDQRAESLARYLRALGVVPDTLVGLCVERRWEMIVGILGILKAGGGYLPLDPSTPSDRRSFIIEDSAVSILLTQESLAGDLLATGAQLVLLDADWSKIKAAGDEPGGELIEPVTVDRLAYVIYTSGTTGRPKGVQITHRAVARLFTATQAWYDFHAGDVWTLFHSFAFDFSVWEIWGALLYGGKLVIVPHLISRSPAEFRALLLDEGVTVLNQTPSAFRSLMQADAAAQDPLSLRYVIFGGEALDIPSLRPWFDRYGDESPQMINMYGITETTVHTTYRRLRFSDLRDVKSMIGVPIPDLQVYLLDHFLQPVPRGVVGEIYVGGAGLARGYLKRPELDAARFIKNPFTDSPGDRLYKSGDIARYLDNGDIEYLGRLDNQVKIRGFRIELGEIEAVLGGHPAVSAAVVRVQKTLLGGDRLVAYVVPKARGAADGALLRGFLAEKLPDYMIPAVFLEIDQLPLTGNGKVDYRALPVPENSRNETKEDLIPPRDPVEQRLIGLWQQVLDVRSIGVRDNFFALGGHSLLAVYLMAQIEREFGRQLPLATLFRNPSVEKLGEVLRASEDDKAWSPLVPIRPGGKGVPFFCVAGGGGNVLYFQQFASHLPDDRPFYGLQAIGLDGRQPPLVSVEAIAREYVKEIREVQPRGPYLLGGHCFGAWIAFEMAGQLQEAGEEISAVLVLDSPAPYLKPNEAALAGLDDALWLAKFAEILSESAGQDLGIHPEQLSALGEEGRIALVKERMEIAGLIPPGTAVQQVRGFFRVFVQNSKISYLPAKIRHVPIALFKAEQYHSDYDYSGADDAAGQAASSTLGWARYATCPPTVDRVQGNHITMMSEPHVADLAAKVAQRLAALFPVY